MDANDVMVMTTAMLQRQYNEAFGGRLFTMDYNARTASLLSPARHVPNVKCEHCGGLYDFGRHGQCPGCGSRSLTPTPASEDEP